MNQEEPDLRKARQTSHSAWPIEVLVGRSEELDELRAALLLAISGQPQYCMIEGVPGVGKTRLSRELASYAAEAGVTVLWGRCYDDTDVPPFWPWIEIIRGYIVDRSPSELANVFGAGAADIAQIVPEIRDKVPGLPAHETMQSIESRFRLFDSIREFLKRAAAENPLLLFFDNLHTCDPSSLRLMQTLFEDIGQTALQIVGNFRPVHIDHPLVETLGELSRCPNSVRIKTGPLTLESVRQFFSSYLGVDPEVAQVETVYGLTEGIPLYVIEVLRLLKQESRRNEGTLWKSELPKAIRVVISRRLNRLSDICNSILIIASLIRGEFSPQEIEAVEPGLSVDQLHHAIDEAVVAAVIEETHGESGSYSFSHALIKDAIASGIAPERRRDLNYRIGLALENINTAVTPGLAANIAQHFCASGRPEADRKAVGYLAKAGSAAVDLFAIDEAFEHYRSAEEICSSVSDDLLSAEVFAGLAKALFLSEHDRKAAPYIVRAFELFRKCGDVDNAVEVAEMQYKKDLGWHWPSVDNALYEVRKKALEIVDEESVEAGRLLCQCGQFADFLEGYEGAAAVYQKAMTIAENHGDIVLQARIMEKWTHTAFVNMRYFEATDKGVRALELARTAGDTQTEQFMLRGAGFDALMTGKPALAKRYISELIQLEENLRFCWESRDLQMRQTYAALVGDWDEASKLAQSILGLYPSDLFSRQVLAAVAYEKGDFDTCGKHLKRLHTSAAENDWLLTDGYKAVEIVIFAKLSEVLDDPKLPLVAVAGAKEVLASELHEPRSKFLATVGLFLAGVAMDDKGLLEMDIDGHSETTGPWITPWGFISIDRILGLRAGALGNAEETKRHFTVAEDFCRRAGYKPELAWVCYDIARSLAHSEDPSESQEALARFNEAIQISADLGMKTLREKAETERASLSSKSAILTKREIEVLNLISEGKSNQEIAFELSISEHTVGNHVANILRKTESANRAEAALYGARHGLIANSD